MPATGPQPSPQGERPTLRAFFALWPSEPVRRELCAWGEACRASAAGRPVRCENLHATLAFLGEIEHARLPELAALAEAVRGAPFTLVLDRLGYWPHNRIVYAGASVMPQPLAALSAGLAHALQGAGFRTEERPDFAHVTLLRAARRAPSDVRVEPLRWEVDAMALVESTRSEGRLVYRPRQRWTLAG